MGRHIRRPAVTREIGLVPHGHHRQHLGLARLAVTGGRRLRVVNVHQDAATAVREIASCSVVITTSLHGLVVADSYGIPAVWTTLDPPLSGGDFKFRDYETALTPGRSRYIEYGDDLTLEDFIARAERTDASMVATRGNDLERSIGRLTELLPDLSSFPLGIVSAHSRR
jgi:hypothetical protein